jgi:hypothetical protein
MFHHYILLSQRILTTVIVALPYPKVVPKQEENVMKKISVMGAALVGAAVLCASPISLHLSQDKVWSLSVDKAQARIGHPLTPGSVAGVHRRHHRRVYRREYYYHGSYYPYRYHGHYYRYRYAGNYYNYRYHGHYYRYRYGGHYYNHRIYRRHHYRYW